MKYLKSFETYNIYTAADPNILDDAPVVDYVDRDYFGIDFEMDETEPPNATGRNDRETKNKLKKSTVKLSV